jgi:SET domain
MMVVLSSAQMRVALLLSFLASSAAYWKNLWSSDASATEQQDPGVCGIWLAESTIPHAGLGMYAGQDFRKGDTLQNDMAIPIVDLAMHNPNVQVNLLWDEYTWSAAALKIHGEGVMEINGASPGFGSAANCFLALINVDEWHPFDMSANVIQLHRSRDPGVGASTRFHYRKSTAKADVETGQEFFVSYGDTWFVSRPQMGPVPLFEDLNMATIMLTRYRKLQQKYDNATIFDDLWATFVKKTAFVQSRTLVGAFRHDDGTELERLKDFDDNVKKLRTNESIRPLEWFETNGVCGDHLEGKRSTIPQAGYGAFSRRDLPEGTLVGGMPLIHIIDRKVLNMFHVVSKIAVDTTKPAGQQLIVNYCYGHAESTLLLCPYGPVVNYVNHNASQANVKLQWSNRLAKDQQQYLTQPLEYLTESGAYAKLAMELVATRNITAGEEIFLDYGAAWEEAWHHHVSTWPAVPHKSEQNYRSASMLTHSLVEPMPTAFEELRNLTMPINVELQCDTTFQSDTWKKHKAKLREYLHEQEGKWWPCDVLRYKKHKDGTYLYTVYMYQGKKKEKQKRIVLNVPVEIFHFVDRPVSNMCRKPKPVAAAFFHVLFILVRIYLFSVH